MEVYLDYLTSKDVWQMMLLSGHIKDFVGSFPITDGYLGQGIQEWA